MKIKISEQASQNRDASNGGENYSATVSENATHPAREPNEIEAVLIAMGREARHAKFEPQAHDGPTDQAVDQVETTDVQQKLADLKLRRELEAIVDSAINGAIDGARAAYKIYTHEDGRLWKEFGSYDKYSEITWRHSKSQAYRLLEMGTFLHCLSAESPDGEKWDPLPICEGQLRPLFATLKNKNKEHRVECWKKIVEETNPKYLTGPMVQEKSREFAKEKGLEDASEVKKKTPSEQALCEIEKLSKALGKLPNPELFNPMLGGIKSLIENANVVDDVQDTTTETPPDVGPGASEEVATTPDTATVAPSS